MKQILFTILFLAAGSTFASTSSEQIYNSLNVQEEILPGPRIVLKYKKEVGGLTCLKISELNKPDNFSCSVTISQVDTFLIYSVLNVQEVVLPAPRTEIKYQKEAGDLSCVKTNHILDGEFVDCDIYLPSL